MIHKVDLTGDYETTIYDAARRLLAEGADSGDRVETRRHGILSMSGVIGELAKWAVVFRAAGPCLVRHKPCRLAPPAAETAAPVHSGGCLCQWGRLAAMNILEALADQNVFAPHFRGSSWKPWKAALAALFALPMDDDALAIYRAATGRSSAPTAPFTEAAFCVGRRGGKSRVLALIAVYLATFRDYRPHLAPGECATIVIMAANKAQARSIFRFVIGLLKSVPLIQPMIIEDNTEQITLSNRVIIEIATASFRTSRGYSFAAVLADEISFWRQDESSANPDIEIMRAVRPGMASIPGSMLLLASSPYAKKGELYNAFRRHHGKENARVLVWKATTATMNPKIDPAIIAEAYASDPEAARAEYGAEFRDDLADFVTREILDAVTMWGRHELPGEPGVTYAPFAIHRAALATA